MIWYHLFVLVAVGLWAGWIWWDSRRTWRNESLRFDAAMKEHDRRAADEIDAAEEWQQSMAARDRRWFR